MKYIFLEHINQKVIKREIAFIDVQDLILKDTNGTGGALNRIKSLSKFNHVTLKSGEILKYEN